MVSLKYWCDSCWQFNTLIDSQIMKLSGLLMVIVTFWFMEAKSKPDAKSLRMEMMKQMLS